MIQNLECVASFTDAWIETNVENFLPQKPSSRIFYRCVDWNLITATKFDPLAVASFTDAWIETWINHPQSCCNRVASFTDAWIETVRCSCNFHSLMSHLLQMRGLKLRSDQSMRISPVASFTDAWIETFCQIQKKYPPKVASFTDAWIETGK